ncbi:MAG: hypothetical protein ACRCY4_07680 [Brevinema sp.]
MLAIFIAVLCFYPSIFYSNSSSQQKAVLIVGNIDVSGHQKATDTLKLEWPSVKDAESYIVSVATLSHRNANITNFKRGDFQYLETTKRRHFSYSPKIPIRRYVFLVEALDGKGLFITNFTSRISYRYPKNVREFLMDVDFTIAHAQRQVPNFGLAGSKRKITGRAQGVYDYAADLLNSRNFWDKYSSFEVVLDGDPKISIIPFPIGAEMTGSVKVSGLYEGEVIYNKLQAQSGGLTVGGTVTARYKHPEKNLIEETYKFDEASTFLRSIVRSTRDLNRALYFTPGIE